MLLLLLSVADSLPNLDDVVAARGQSLGEKYAVVVIECLTSSKSETRSAALSLLGTSVENGIVSVESIKKATEKLKPALQRSVGPLVAKMAKNAPAPSQPEKENLPSREKFEAVRAEPVSSENGQRLSRKAQIQTANIQTSRRRKEGPAPASPDRTPPKHPLIPRSGKHVAGSQEVSYGRSTPKSHAGPLLKISNGSGPPFYHQQLCQPSFRALR